jgi:hypothetical protein
MTEPTKIGLACEHLHDGDWICPPDSGIVRAYHVTREGERADVVCLCDVAAEAYRRDGWWLE